MAETMLKELQCGICGVSHALPRVMWQKCYDEGGFWYCPNGHSRGYDKGHKDRNAIYLERDRLKQRLAQKDDEIRHQIERRDAAQRSAAAYRGQATKLKKRAAAGVCPCCNRSFNNLARHMHSKHPEFQEDTNVYPLEVKA